MHRTTRHRNKQKLVGCRIPVCPARTRRRGATIPKTRPRKGARGRVAPKWRQVVALHNEKRDHQAMAEIAHDSLAAHLRSMSIDNFSISGDTVRIGRTRWSASVCRCGDRKCDGWSLEPLEIVTALASAAQAAPRMIRHAEI